MSQLEEVEFNIKPRLGCNHLERKLIKIKNEEATFKTICPLCDNYFADNGDDIEKRLERYSESQTPQEEKARNWILEAIEAVVYKNEELPGMPK